MTCCEVLLGQILFENLRATDYDVILQGSRPEARKYVQPWIKNLLDRCWHPNPLARPTFHSVECLIDREYISDSVSTWHMFCQSP